MPRLPYNDALAEKTFQSNRKETIPEYINRLTNRDAEHNAYANQADPVDAESFRKKQQLEEDNSSEDKRRKARYDI